MSAYEEFCGCGEWSCVECHGADAVPTSTKNAYVDGCPPVNAQIEPPYRYHRTVVFSFRWPDWVAHTRSLRCSQEAPHLIAECAEFAAPVAPPQ